MQRFEFDGVLSHEVTGHTRQSRFLLYENGSFTLEFPHVQYRGTYERQGDAVTFRWEGWSTAGEWGATGTLSGEQMVVRYNIVMQLSDFEDAIYRRDS